MFLVAVLPGPQFRFEGLNRVHEDATGLSCDALRGKTPREVLPHRLAETVEANYRACHDLGRAYSYEECLDLPTGHRWWQTTLMPLRDPDGIFAILGSAVDITALKAENARLRFDLEARRAGSGDTPCPRLPAEELRGPLNTIRGLAQSVQGDDGAADAARVVVDMILEISARTITALDRLPPSSAQPLTARQTADFGHLCRDFVALVDPAGSLDITCSDARIACDASALQVVFYAVLDEVTRCAARRLSIAVTPDPISLGHVRIVMSLDVLANTRLDVRKLHSLSDIYGFRTDSVQDGGDACISLRIPGHFVSSTERGDSGRRNAVPDHSVADRTVAPLQVGSRQRLTIG